MNFLMLTNSFNLTLLKNSAFVLKNSSNLSKVVGRLNLPFNKKKLNIKN